LQKNFYFSPDNFSTQVTQDETKLLSRDLIKLKSTEDGLHIADSILWLDSHLNGELSFLSSASALTKAQVPQVIATEETVKILDACGKKPTALICQYNRPFSIGRLKMELLPSGSILGGASLYVETEKGRVLYAPCLQPHPIATVRKMQVKRANALILGAFHPDPHQSMPNRRKEKEKLITALKEQLALGKTPVVLCDPISTAQEITKFLAEAYLPISVSPTIYRVNKVYESCGSPLGQYSLHSKRKNGPRVLILPKSRRSKNYFAIKHQDGPIFSIEDTLPQYRRDTSDAFVTKVVDTFYLSSHCDGPELKAIIQLVAPKELFFFGPYAKRYVDEMAGICPKIKPLFVNDQPTLF
jgi:Cft2 family RNA processing exonuclease